jgi:hypothetical protein
MKKITKEELETLKQYVEKELQSKKFLSDTVDMISAVEKMFNERLSHESNIAHLVAEIQEQTKKLSLAERETDAAAEMVETSKKLADEIVAEAKAQAKALIDNAKNREAAIAESNETELKHVKARVAAGLKELVDLKSETEALVAEKLKIEQEIAQLKAKFA